MTDIRKIRLVTLPSFSPLFLDDAAAGRLKPRYAGGMGLAAELHREGL